MQAAACLLQEMGRRSSTASIVILFSLVVFNHCEGKNIKEDAQAENEQGKVNCTIFLCIINYTLSHK